MFYKILPLPKPIFLLPKHPIVLKQQETELRKHVILLPKQEIVLRKQDNGLQKHLIGLRKLEKVLTKHDSELLKQETPLPKHDSELMKHETPLPKQEWRLCLPVNSRSRFILLPLFVVSWQNVVANRCKQLPNPERLHGLLPSPSCRI